MTQAAGQGFALLGQGLLLFKLGDDRYAPIALALIAAQIASFIGELGYGRRLMAEAARTGGASHSLYRTAVGRRLIFLSAIASLLVIGWIALRGADDSGLPTLLAALPAILFSAWDPDPILHGLGRHRLAGIALAGRWGIFTVILLIATLMPDEQPDLLVAILAGLALSANFSTHLLAAWKTGLPLRPAFDFSLHIAGAGALWFAAILGTAYWGILPFLIEARQPDFAAWAILGLQILNSLAALLGRLDRIILPLLANRSWDRVPYAFLSACAALPCLAALFAVYVIAPDRFSLLNALILAEWQFIACTGFLVPWFVSQNREKALLALHLLILPAAIVAQFTLAGMSDESLAMLLWLRVLATGLLLLGAQLALRVREATLVWPVLAGLPLAAMTMGSFPAATPVIAAVWGLLALVSIRRSWPS
ncbi:MAG: hypothetical protein KKC98_07175 [Alphaproteobacteria bacterium]|nr:hypothetical protein [Alphaproteobacteria bacterium]MBU1812091.1 hypothetical protein [Alphaproteobacteria bacterium]